MARFLPASLLVVLTATAAKAQQPTPSLPPAPTPTDTLRHTFRGTWPDSLATAPTPGTTLQLQGQDQPARPFLTIQDQLRTVAGVQVTPYDGSPGSGNVVRIRGASVASGLAQPLYVIDGLPALNDDLTPGQSYGLTAPMAPFEPSNNYPYQPTVAERNAEVGASPLQLLPPDAIASIEVLAGPAAVARYGPLATNGVISITTRTGQTSRPLRVRYAAYVGVQQVRQRYDLLNATQYAQVANEAVLNAGSTALPFPSTNLGAGTDWQAETYRTAGLQQHLVSLEGGRDKTSFLLSLDYRKQHGVMQHADLTRLGLRLALDQRVGQRLHLRGTAALSQTSQQLPYTTGNAGATRTALLAPPTQPVRNPDGIYSGYNTRSNFGPSLALTNPVAVADYAYRTPRTRRMLAQLAADYKVLPHLTAHAAANFQRTILTAESNRLYTYYDGATLTPPTSQNYATQIYRTSQWGAQLALRYAQQLGTRHAIGAEIDYQYQGNNLIGRTDYLFSYGNAGFSSGYYEAGAELRLHRPWARLQYSLDSALTVEAGLSYAHYRDANRTEYYPNAQVSWQARSGRPTAMRLWLGTGRTSTLGANFPLFGPARLISPSSGPGTFSPMRLQSPLYADQLEAGLHLGRRHGRLTGQLVAYQRTSHHALVEQLVPVALSGGGFSYLTGYDEATIRNQGLELTLAADWQHGRLQGSTRLVCSLNRNRLREQQENAPLNPAFDNHPTGTFYGYRQDGVDVNGARRFVRSSNSTANLVQGVLGGGIPTQLASLSQQLRLGRLALDAQVDGMFGYQVLNQQLDLLDSPTGITNSATTVNDRWTPTNPNTTIPAAGVGSRVYDPSIQYGLNFSANTPDRLLENGTHVRLSSLTLTYRLRQTETQDISVWVGGQNLLVLTGYRGYDPNVSSGGNAATYAGIDFGAVPVPRTWLLGVKAEF
jgi:hypothetical protein